MYPPRYVTGYGGIPAFAPGQEPAQYLYAYLLAPNENFSGDTEKSARLLIVRFAGTRISAPLRERQIVDAEIVIDQQTIIDGVLRTWA